MVCNAGLCENIKSWYEAVDSVEAFVAATESTGVPVHLRREIYPALRLNIYPEANAAMTETFLTMSSLEEFMAAIACLPTNSATCPTGISLT